MKNGLKECYEKYKELLINTSVNTLDHVKVLIESLKINLSNQSLHEILIFIDSDNEGTENYLNKRKILMI